MSINIDLKFVINQRYIFVFNKGKVFNFKIKIRKQIVKSIDTFSKPNEFQLQMYDPTFNLVEGKWTEGGMQAGRFIAS